MTEQLHGYSKEYVSGPLQVTKQVGAEDGLLGSYTLCLYWNPTDEGKVIWVDFELFGVIAAGSDGSLSYQKRDSEWWPNYCDDLASAEVAAEGHVKWDGCMDLDITSTHLCSRRDFVGLLNAIETAREECALAMPGTDVYLEYA